MLRAAVRPDRRHRAGVLADGDGEAGGGAELHRDGADGVEERGVLAGLAAGGHPVGGELDLPDLGDAGGSEVEDGLGDGEAAGRGCVDDRDGRALAARHRGAVVALVAGRDDGVVGDGQLERTAHLVAVDHAGDGAVGDRDEERLVGDGRVREHAPEGVGGLGGDRRRLRLRRGGHTVTRFHGRTVRGDPLTRLRRELPQRGSRQVRGGLRRRSRLPRRHLRWHRHVLGGLRRRSRLPRWGSW